jgi:hypothetical protein
MVHFVKLVLTILGDYALVALPLCVENSPLEALLNRFASLHFEEDWVEVLWR